MNREELTEKIRTGTVFEDYWGTRWKVLKYSPGIPDGYSCKYLSGPYEPKGHDSCFVPIANIKEIEDDQEKHSEEDSGEEEDTIQEEGEKSTPGDSGQRSN